VFVTCIAIKIWRWHGDDDRFRKTYRFDGVLGNFCDKIARSVRCFV